MAEQATIGQGDDIAETGKEQILTDVFDNLRRVFQAVQEYSKRIERETGLTVAQAWTVRAIAENELINISAIAQQMHLHVATVVGIVDRLEARGLARRCRSKKDRRVVNVELTEEGRALVEHSPGVFSGMLLSGLEALPNRKLKAIQSGLDIMVRIMKAQQGVARAGHAGENRIDTYPDRFPKSAVILKATEGF
jgi:DNA-binding MarR family transcriptional regulator